MSRSDNIARARGGVTPQERESCRALTAHLLVDVPVPAQTPVGTINDAVTDSSGAVLITELAKALQDPDSHHSYGVRGGPSFTTCPRSSRLLIVFSGPWKEP
jgi:phage antirepressor YoqD-like protein